MTGQKANDEYQSGYLPQFEDFESEFYCQNVGDETLRAATCDVAPNCGHKTCEYGFKGISDLDMSESLFFDSDIDTSDLDNTFCTTCSP